ncbi:MAG: Na/Pi cotransporter family protein [Spirochaetales bacterium]|jgi:phosphate:Na+ symporter|nr:Na/Pi cotransporter family protein [Spirochaetales bacterium]
MMTFLQFIGSLGLFLFGMNVMSDGLQKAAGERLQAVLNYMTRNRVTAILTGFFITCIIQASGATTVMVVSFVNAQLLTLVQGIGVIMGANIGTTFTGWIVAILGFQFNIAQAAVPIVGLGIPFYFSKKSNRHNAGQTLIGFGLLFLGLSMLKDSLPDISQNQAVLAFLRTWTSGGGLSFLFFILVGTVFTILVQSSSAAMAVTLSMANAGWIGIDIAAAIILGENIGTTITAFLASLGANVNARRAALAHMFFNVLGVIWVSLLIKPVLGLVEFIIPGDIAGPEDFPARLALFHTLFNLGNTLLWVWFVNPAARFLCWLIPEKDTGSEGIYSLKYISGHIQTTPEFNILNAKLELSKMTGILEEMYDIFHRLFLEPQETANYQKDTERVRRLEDYTDQMQEQLTAFLIQCSKEELSQESVNHVILMMRIVNELESIGDSIYNLVIQCQRRIDQKIELDSQAINEVNPYMEKVRSFISFIRAHLNRPLSDSELSEARSLEWEIDKTRNTLHKSARARLRENGNVKSELMIINMVQHLEHIGDYSINVAEALRKM